MARRLFKSQTLTGELQRQRQHLLPSSWLLPRRFSSLPEEAEVPEVETAGSDDGEKEDFTRGFRGLESAIYRVVVMRSAPDWLPFVPGSSYWVPPRKKLVGSQGLEGLIGKKLVDPMKAEEAMSLTSKRGWPSSAYFIDGSLPRPVIEKTERNIANQDDEKT